MSTYPADIQKAASDAIYSFTADGNFSPNQMTGAFCRAIAMERERCVELARAQIRRDWSATDYEEGYHRACADIASILKGDAGQ